MSSPDYYVVSRSSDGHKALYSSRGALLATWGKERGVDMNAYIQEHIKNRAFAELGNLHGDVVVEDRDTNTPAVWAETIEVKATKAA